MTGKTHLAAGILAGEALALVLDVHELSTIAFMVTGAAAGSLLPDIDHPKSMFSQSNLTTKTVSSVVSTVAKHRGFTHTLVFAALLWALLRQSVCLIPAIGTPIAYAVIAGLLSHLILDTFNEKGVMWFWPVYRKHIHILGIRTGFILEFVLRLALSVAVTLGLLLLLMEAGIISL